jgi:hypothetical protein
LQVRDRLVGGVADLDEIVTTGRIRWRIGQQQFAVRANDGEEVAEVV